MTTSLDWFVLGLAAVFALILLVPILRAFVVELRGGPARGPQPGHSVSYRRKSALPPVVGRHRWFRPEMPGAPRFSRSKEDKAGLFE